MFLGQSAHFDRHRTKEEARISGSFTGEFRERSTTTREVSTETGAEKTLCGTVDGVGIISGQVCMGNKRQKLDFAEHLRALLCVCCHAFLYLRERTGLSSLACRGGCGIFHGAF